MTSRPGVVVPLLRSNAPVPRQPAARSFTARDGSRGSLVAASVVTPLSTWQVTYTGFSAQQQTAFQAAVDIWAGIVQSAVPIKVNAELVPTEPGLLGFAGPYSFFGHSTIGDGQSLYPSALANALTGSDVDPTHEDIDASFSSSEPGIYYGTDGLPPANNLDFESIVLHELGHGLGFLGSADMTGANGTFNPPPLIFDRFNANSGGSPLTNLANGSAALGAALTNNAVYWNGSWGRSHNSGSLPRLYAPTTWSSGSSIAHLNEATYAAGNPNSLMTPFLQDQEVIHNPGPLTIGIFRDMGWQAFPAAPMRPTNVSAVAGNGEATISWTAPADNGSSITGYTILTSPGGAVTPASGTSTTVTGLTNDTPYTFVVTATNAVGASAASLSSTAVTPTGPDVTAPNAFITAGPGASAKPDGSIVFSASDPGHPSAVLTFSCTFDTVVTTPCSSPFPYSGLADGTTHDFSVVATDQAANTSSPQSRSWVVDAVAPTVSVTSGPPAVTPSPTASFTFAAADAGRPAAVLVLRCNVDGTTSLCPAPASYSGLANGVHTLQVTATDEAGNVSAPVSSTWRVDSIAPTIAPQAVPMLSLATSVGLRFTTTDPGGSGVANQDVRWRRAPYNGAFAALTYPAAWQATHATSVTLAASKGYTYCLSARSRDNAGNTSAWSVERCTSVALDDRSLAASAGWSRGVGSAYYSGTITSTARKGVSLTRTGVQTRRVALVVTTCHGCGAVAIYWNGKLVRTVNLSATTTTHRRVLSILDFGGVKAGTLTIRTTNTGRTYVDGIVLSRV